MSLMMIAPRPCLQQGRGTLPASQAVALRLLQCNELALVNASGKLYGLPATPAGFYAGAQHEPNRLCSLAGKQ